MENNVFKSRKDPRIRTAVTASFRKLKSDDRQKDGIVTNFSRTGLYVETEFVFPVSTQVYIDVYLPEEKLPLHLEGEVRNVIPDDTAIGGMGIQIDTAKINNTDKERLEEFFNLNHIYGWFC
ncbi:MAG: PilZ domain-containing protein [Spirochaetales bacterium]|nr:PilZ domain-containing protein [Spirochaetales bacterium]